MAWKWCDRFKVYAVIKSLQHLIQTRHSNKVTWNLQTHAIPQRCGEPGKDYAEEAYDDETAIAMPGMSVSKMRRLGDVLHVFTMVLYRSRRRFGSSCGRRETGCTEKSLHKRCVCARREHVDVVGRCKWWDVALFSNGLLTMNPGFGGVHAVNWELRTCDLWSRRSQERVRLELEDRCIATFVREVHDPKLKMNPWSHVKLIQFTWEWYVQLQFAHKSYFWVCLFIVRHWTGSTPW